MTKSIKPPISQALACIILAAGQGKRMHSVLPKVLHKVAGQPMIRHVVGACEAVGAGQILTVIAPAMDAVAKAVSPYPCAIQNQPKGTGDAVKAAMPHLESFEGDVLVLFGDTPLITPQSIGALIKAKEQLNVSIVVSSFVPEHPGRYGRLLMNQDGGTLVAIVEAADATPEQAAIRQCNGGIMLFDGAVLKELLPQLRCENAQGEYYLTDCVSLANAKGYKVGVAAMPENDVLGVNTMEQLAAVEAIMQKRLRRKHMEAGVTLRDPESVFLSADTQFGRDVVIEPSVVFGEGVTTGDNVLIRSFSHIEGAAIGTGARIGPFARLRPGSQIGSDAHIGNFVEIKNSKIAKEAKINHLSYIGDADIGEVANIGAGTITCNYDGFNKYRTVIGAGVRIGSNTSLIAPVTVGDGAMTGAGTVVTKDVPSDALALSRVPQKNEDNWARILREKKRP